MTFISHEILFPEVKITDHLQQAAEDITTILTQPPAATVPSLQGGDLVQNALLDIATQLRCVEEIPKSPRVLVSPTRVRQDQINCRPTTTRQPTRLTDRQCKATKTTEDVQLTRVVQTKQPTLVDLLEKRTIPQHLRYKAPSLHKYNLCTCQPLPWNKEKGFRHQATKFLTVAAAHLYQLMVNHIYCPDSNKETIDLVRKGSDRTIWNQSLSNEWGRLAQGNNNGVLATDTINFITKEEILKGCNITYTTFVLDYCPLKSEPH